jgi:hypothetical protein
MAEGRADGGASEAARTPVPGMEAKEGNGEWELRTQSKSPQKKDFLGAVKSQSWVRMGMSRRTALVARGPVTEEMARRGASWSEKPAKARREKKVSGRPAGGGGKMAMEKGMWGWLVRRSRSPRGRSPLWMSSGRGGRGATAKVAMAPGRFTQAVSSGMETVRRLRSQAAKGEPSG